jgi:hypothetical protein
MTPDSSRGVASYDYSSGILAALGVPMLPGVELGISLPVHQHPLLRLRRGEYEAIVVPRRLHETKGALTIEAAEIHRLRTLSLFVGHLFKLLARHARGGDAMEIAAVLEGFCHRGVAGNAGGGS